MQAATTTKPDSADIFYDADCRLCAGTARRFQRVLARRHLELVPLQAPDASARLGVPPDGLLDEMRLRLPDGTVFGGADAVVEIARHVWWAWPLWALSRAPGAMPPLRAAYAWFARRRNCTGGVCERRSSAGLRPVDVLPLVTLPAIVLMFRTSMPPWVFMWSITFALYAGCKWLTYREGRARALFVDPRRALAYLFLWPGMDATEFLVGTPRGAARHPPSEWVAAALKTLLGASLIWIGARTALPGHPLVAGWLGMTGLVFILHFGTFALLSLGWQSLGVDAPPVMRHPQRSTSLAEFWGRRWNTAFHELAVRYTFRPLRQWIGPTSGSLLVFVVSGLVHELVISVPARGGYGLPTGYFVLQGLGIAGERTRIGRRLGLGGGRRGRVFTILVTAGPAFWLFPPPFVYNIILPMLAAIGAS